MTMKPDNSGMRWDVRECRTRAELERLFRFRYNEYVEKKGLFQDIADHENRQLTDPVDAFGINFLAEAGGETIGSIRMNDFKQFVQTFCITEFGVEEISADMLTRGCIVTRAMVHLDWRRKPVFVDLALSAARRLRDNGLRWMVVDTATSRKAGEEDRFISLYRSMGFEVWRRDAAVPGIGTGAVLVFDLEKAMANPKSLARLYLSEPARTDAAVS